MKKLFNLKALQMLVVAAIVVSVTVLVAACGSSTATNYRLASVTSGEVTIDLTSADGISTFMTQMGMDTTDMPDGTTDMLLSAINAVTIAQNGNDLSINVNFDSALNAVMTTLVPMLEQSTAAADDSGTGSATADEMAAALQTITDNIANVPSMSAAITFKTKTDGNNLVLVNKDGDAIDMQGVTITKSKTALTFSLSADVFGADVSIVFNKI